MKTLFDILKTVFLCLGAVIGANFISGSELLVFFGTQNFAITILISAFCFLISINLVFSVAVSSDFLRANKLMFSKSNLFNGVSVLCNFVLFVSMLAGIDSLSKQLNLFNGYAVLSIVSLVLVACFSKFGISGLEKLNLFLMPCVLIIVNFLVFKSQSYIPIEFKFVAFTDGVKALLYCALNTFISLPVLFATAKGKSKLSLKVSSIIISMIIFIQAVLILAVVCNNDSQNSFSPLLSALSKQGASVILITCFFLCSLTSLSSSFYPVYECISARYGSIGIVIVCFLAFIFSRLGVSVIITFVYPVIGAFGLVYLIKLYLLKRKEKVYFKGCIKGVK